MTEFLLIAIVAFVILVNGVIQIFCGGTTSVNGAAKGQTQMESKINTFQIDSSSESLVSLCDYWRDAASVYAAQECWLSAYCGPR